MQLILKKIVFLSFCFFSIARAQDSTKIHLEDIEIDFLFNYYEQDGNHSPVTGGVGTEELDNLAPSIAVKIPISQKQTISMSGGIDFYSSASSDNISNPLQNPDQVSGASASDFRAYGTASFEQKNKQKNTLYSGFLGASFEYDVASISGGGSYSKSFKENNRTFAIKGSYIYDQWKLIYPVELRNGSEELLEDDTRQSFNLSPSFSFIINKRMNASVIADFTYQTGLLSTPFHRVYFSDFNEASRQSLLFSSVEKLPISRFKLPVAGRLNINITDFLLFKGYYRFYYDTWGVMGNTIKIELPVKIKDFLRFYPFYRFHIQTASDYFAPFATHDRSEEYYTSDFDLSNLNSHKIGLGVSVEPLYGIFRFKGGKERLNMLKSIDFRYAHYRRSDGLVANMYTVAFSYRIQR